MRTYQYDVALSYAGEDREYVAQVAEHLRNARVKVYFDHFETVGVWGKNLYQHLSKVYRDEARYCIPFISRYYVKKPWPRREVDAALARALTESDYVLPVRFDDANLPGLEKTIAWLDARTLSPNELAELITEKVNSGFTHADIAEFYDLWHASVPTKNVVERLQERLERASLGGSTHSRLCQARLSIALAEQYTKVRESALARAAVSRALALIAPSSGKGFLHEETQISLDCQWLTLIVERFENHLLWCVQECQKALQEIADQLRMKPSRTLRSQYLLHRCRIERSLITYYQLAGKLPESLKLAESMQKRRWGSLEKDLIPDALAKPHLLPSAVMNRLLIYEKFQTARRILSAYAYVGDHRSALGFLPSFFDAFESVVKAGALDTISMVVFNKLCGECAGLLALNNPSEYSRRLSFVAKEAFVLSRVSALQQELPSSYRKPGLLEKTVVPVIDLSQSALPSRTKHGQLAYLRRLRTAFAAVRTERRIGIDLFYPNDGECAPSYIATLAAGGGSTMVAAFSASQPSRSTPALRELCENVLIQDAGAEWLLSEKEIQKKMKGALKAARVVPDAEVSLFFARWTHKSRRLRGFSVGAVTLANYQTSVSSSHGQVSLFDVNIDARRTRVLFGWPLSQQDKDLHELARPHQYSCISIW